MRHASCHHAITSRDEDHPCRERYGCRYQKRESCRHDRFDEASRAIREKIEDEKFRAKFRETRARGDMHKSTSKDL